jgi:hypothetical protein
MNVTGVRIFSEPIKLAASAVSSLVQGAAPFASAMSALASGGGSVSIDPQYRALLEQQMAFQRDMQVVTMQTNTSRTEHETRMTVVRNVRVA